MFEPYLSRWGLVPDGSPIITHAGRLLPVRFKNTPAMLKIAESRDEQLGAAVMEWWSGDGAARVFAREGEAVLMERAEGTASLADMARDGDDDEASRILCSVAARLHAPRPQSPPEVVPLSRWFHDLETAAPTYGGILSRSADAARQLLSEPCEIVVLHGDLHHDNVLDFGGRGWLAIDPKGVIGERGFDFANIFTNPDLSDPTRPVATMPGRFAKRLNVVASAAGMERKRLLRWILAWTGLSAAWYLSDGDPADIDRAIAEMAAAELDR